MIRKPKLDAKRLTTGVLVAGVVAAGAVALASPALAAGGPVNSISITPSTQDAASGVCATYTIDELAADGSAATSGTFMPIVSLTGGNSPSVCGGALTQNSSTEYTVQVKDTNTSSTPVSVNIKVSDSATTPTVTSNATLKVANTANDFVKTINVSPSSASANAGGSVPYTVTALDGSNNPVVGASVVYQFSGTGGTNNNACATTNAKGVATCTVAAGTSSSTITFYVNNDASTTPGFDSGVEPSGTSTLTVTPAPAVDQVTLTCTNQGTAGSNTSCVVPVGTGSEKFTATANNTVNGVETPVSGAQITFAVTSANGTVTPVTAITGTDGTATTTLTPSSTTANESDTVTATSVNGKQGTASVSFEKAQATTLKITPGTEDAQIGSSITETGTVTDQFGNPVSGDTATLTLGASTRNPNTTVTGKTNAQGQISLTYTDKGTTTGSDTVTFSETSQNLSATATITYLASVTPTAVSLNFTSGAPTTCPAPTTTAASQQTNVVGDTREVCAQVTNNNGATNLQGQTVTFTVSQGTVAATSGGATGGSASTTYTATTDGNGVATAYVSATKAGAQTISASASGVASNTLTDTFAAGTETSLTLTPTGQTFAPGGSYQFTAKATDKYGNPTADYIYFAQTGPGALSSNEGVYAPNGVANIVLNVPANATPGSGSVTAYSDDTNNTATATYTVSPTVARSLALKISGAAKIGAAATATATVTGTDGNPLGGELVTFKVTGKTVTTGTATTNSSGVATFNFAAQHAGSFTVTATASSASVSDTATGSTAKTLVTATLSLTSTHVNQIMENATISLKKAGVAVHFYSVKNGVKTYVASVDTNSSGFAHYTVKALKPGTTYYASAKATGLSSDYTAVTSPTKSKKVS